ncbi:hypothetical protein [Chishuiella changwenlii]|uniref:hypothetical protein n=1 Tax=Chishuiella changwenlii TaxID=1434701 RepID=UPI002FDA9235
MNLSIEYLEEVYSSGKLAEKFQSIIGVIIKSINDWPTPIVYLSDFNEILFSLIKDDANQNTLNNYISSLDISKNAWIIESLTQLLEMYDYYNSEETIHSIFKDIENRIL